jgi:hypothetical protein
MRSFEAIRWHPDGIHTLTLYAARFSGGRETTELDGPGLCGLGEPGDAAGTFRWNEDSVGPRLQIAENRRVLWKIEGGDPVPKLVTDLPDSVVSRRLGDREGDLQALNLLGDSRIQFAGSTLNFTLVSEKLNYEEEFRTLTEALADEAQGFLNDWSGAGLSFTPTGSEPSDLDWVRFGVLRRWLPAETLRSCLAQISNRPDTLLRIDEAWVPAGRPAGFRPSGPPSSWGRGWHLSGGRPVPESVRSSVRQETPQTPANGFLVHILTQFLSMVRSVAPRLKGELSRTEALEYQEILDSALGSSFLREVEPVGQVPHSSQVLQKRSGYREIFQTWVLSEASAVLRWDPSDESFFGHVRDAAELYEYWCFFVLYGTLVRGPLGFRLAGHKVQYQSTEGLGFSLVKGAASRLVLRRDASVGAPFGLVAVLYYNRTYSSQDQGSYTSPVHPDYSLVFYPDYFPSEDAAFQAEKVLLLHFDAKYRVESVPRFELLDDKDEGGAASLTFKKSDLYKMHTYVDAIRRSSGSFIFYPGDPEGSGSEWKPFTKYRELFPGVGAFSLRPRKSEWDDQVGSRDLAQFLAKAVHAHSSRFRRHYRQMRLTGENFAGDQVDKASSILDRFPPTLFAGNSPKDTLVLLGYVPDGIRDVVFVDRKFYFWAVDRQGRPFHVGPEIFTAEYFLPYRRGDDGQFETDGQLFQILREKEPSQTAVSQAELATEIPHHPSGRPHQVSFYYVIDLVPVVGNMPVMRFPFDEETPGKGFLPRVFDFEEASQWPPARPLP